MIYTNEYNLPEGMVKALSEESYLESGRMSITDLINPPLIRSLKIEKNKEIIIDITDNLWALLGHAVHYVLSKVGGETELKVEYLLSEIYSWPDLTVVGKIDRYSKEGIIEDYKITSVWSFLNGLKDEWAAQLNCYDWLCQKVGLGRAKGLRINAILRDWQVSKTIEKDYPRIPFLSMDVPQWPFEEQDMFVCSKLDHHRLHSHRECTASEKWQRETTYAVMKTGRKSALRVLENLDAARQWCYDNSYMKIELGTWALVNNIAIVKRPGEYIRCNHYCPVRGVCSYVLKGKNEYRQ